VTLLDSEFFTPYVVNALSRANASDDPVLAALGHDPGVVEAVGRLAAWDHTTPTGIPQGYDASDVDGQLAAPSPEEIANSVAATIYSVWRGRYVRNVIDAHIAPYSLPQPGSDEAMKALKNLLLTFDTRHGVGASGLDFYAVPGVTDPADRRDVLLLRSVSDALGLLAGPSFDAAFHGSTNQGDYRWGLLHRIVFGSVLGPPWSTPPAGGAFPAPLPGLSGIPTDGGFNTVDAASHSARAASVNEFMFGGGPVRRFVAQAQPGGMRAVSALPGGTSEDLGSPYYLNLLPRWLTNDTYPVRLYQQDLVKATASVIRYLPS
jgi:penicillin amidase